VPVVPGWITVGHVVPAFLANVGRFCAPRCLTSHYVGCHRAAKG
jgi:hypothetical protein